MARLQVLYLPDRALPDGDSERRFGLVFDQLDPPLADEERADFDNFAHACGAERMLATTRTVDCDQGEDVDWPEEFAQEMREMVDGRIKEHIQEVVAHQQAQQKPAPDTAEGKTARTWGGSAQDPRDAIRAKVSGSLAAAHGQVSSGG